MRVINIQYDSDNNLIVTIEMPELNILLKDIHVSSNFHKQDTLAAIGQQLIDQIAKYKMKEI